MLWASLCLLEPMPLRSINPITVRLSWLKPEERAAVQAVLVAARAARAAARGERAEGWPAQAAEARPEEWGPPEAVALV